jgi:hypothetical protein
MIEAASPPVIQAGFFCPYHAVSSKKRYSEKSQRDGFTHV